MFEVVIYEPVTKEKTMTKKPKYRIYAKSKASNNYQNLLAFWENENGISGVLDKEVAKIILKNGSVITGDAVYLNMKIQPDEHSQELPKAVQEKEQVQAYSETDADEIPF